ncbi:MAG: TPM domain-containing protein [Vicinamibacterales bacterium]
MATAGRPSLGRLSILLVVSLVVAVCLAAAPAAAQPAPPPLTDAVNDFANVLDSSTTEQLKDLITRLQTASGDVMVIATVKTFQPWPDLKSYAVKMFENGGKGIGTKGKDNGALILLALDDRQVWIETGYGLEGFITDGFAGQTSRETMVPHFRSGDYSGGMLAGATAVARRIAEGRNVDLNLAPVDAPREGPSGRSIPFGVWIILLIIFLNIINRRGPGSRSGRRWASGAGAFGAASSWSRGGWGGGGGFGGGGFGGFGGGRSGGGGGGGSW